MHVGSLTDVMNMQVIDSLLLENLRELRPRHDSNNTISQYTHLEPFVASMITRTVFGFLPKEIMRRVDLRGDIEVRIEKPPRIQSREEKRRKHG